REWPQCKMAGVGGRARADRAPLQRLVALADQVVAEGVEDVRGIEIARRLPAGSDGNFGNARIVRCERAAAADDVEVARVEIVLSGLGQDGRAACRDRE